MYPPPQGDPNQPQQPYGQPPGYQPPPGYGAQPQYGAPPAYNQQQPFGQQQPYGYPGMQPVANQSNGLAIASMILGILIVLFGPFSGIPAVITGHMALGRIKQNAALGGRGMAITGLVLGYLSIAGTLLLVVLVVIAAASGVSTTYINNP